jgi:hypothetical protein
VFVVAFGLALLAPSSALAAFTRPFLCQTPPGSFTGFGPEGVAVDAADHLWISETLPGKVEIGEQGHDKLYGFNSAYSACGGPIMSLAIEGFDFPARLAIESSTSHFYVVGQLQSGGQGYVEVFDSTGKLVERWKHQFEDPYVAVDNSTEPFDLSAGSVYVTHRHDPEEPGGDGAPPGIGKFAASGKPVPFTGSAAYIKGSEIVGTPTESVFDIRPESIVVDSQGDIYAVNNGAHNGEGEVDEFSPSGVFMQAFTGKETPGLGENHERGGFGGELAGVAVDPVSGHVLVAVSGSAPNTANQGAVDEFDSTTGQYLNQITETEVEVSPGKHEKSHLHSAKEMTVDSHGDLYVVDDRSKAVDAYGPGHFLPSLRLAEASGRKPASAVLNDSVDPEGFSLTDCHFEYVPQSQFEVSGFESVTGAEKAPCAPAAGSIPADSEYHPVHAEVTGLASGTTYRYRLVATTSGELGGTEYSGSLAFTAPHAPRVDSTSATNLSSTFAGLRAQINPLGAETTYYFQYVDQAHYEPEAEDPYALGATAPSNTPATAVDIGSGGATGNADASVAQQIGGLAPGTTYHFRAIATNEIGTTAGAMCEGEFRADCTFTTLPLVVPGLPDGRAYELLTPPNKGSAPDMFGFPVRNHEFTNLDFGYPSESGDGFLLETRAAFGPFPASVENAYVFGRDKSAGRWEMTALTPPSLGVQSIAEVVFDPVDFSKVGFQDTVGSLASEGGTQRENLAGPLGGPYPTLHKDAPVHGGQTAAAELTEIAGASHDLSRLVLESKGHAVCPGAESQDPESRVLCEWAGGYETVNGELKPELTLVNVNSEGSLLNPCGARLGEVGGSTHNAVSYDGSKVFFTAPDPVAQNMGPGCWKPATETSPEANPPQLYMRSGGATVELSAPESGVSDPCHPLSSGCHPAVYVGASEDGSKVFFVTETVLTEDAAKLKLHDLELYEYNGETGKLTRISAGEPGSSGANVVKVPAVAAHGSAVYFTALGRLTSDAKAVKGEEVNLYRYDTVTRKTAYVGTVNAGDYPLGNYPSSAIALRSDANWYTTPDGRYLLFASSRELTSYVTGYATGNGTVCFLPETQEHVNGHCEELYRYDSRAAEKHEQPVVCVSCNPSGAPPTSNALFARSARGTRATGPVRAMSDAGSYVFFDTADALVAQDSNGTLDVYEWHEGRISLISSGKNAVASFFLGASPDGANVFFGTHARLVPQDTDTNGDVYDARICTEADPCIKPPSGGTGLCEGDACQNPSPAPIDATPVTAAISAEGDLAGEVKPKVKPKTKGEPTNAQKLAKALKACRKKAKGQRKKCGSQVRRRYGKKANGAVRARHAGSHRRAGR